MAPAALRKLDLQDLTRGRPPLDRAAYWARVRAVCKSQRAQRAGAAYAKGLRNVCKEVVKKKGAASRG